MLINKGRKKYTLQIYSVFLLNFKMDGVFYRIRLYRLNVEDTCNRVVSPWSIQVEVDAPDGGSSF